MLATTGKMQNRTTTRTRLKLPKPNQKPNTGTMARMGMVWVSTA